MMATPGQRRMRRTRSDAASNHLLSSYDLYTLQGDAVGATELLELDTASSFYNQCILHQLQKKERSTDDFLEKLSAEEAKTKANYPDWVPAKKVRRNELICAYNRALIYYAKGDIQQAVSICVKELGDLEQPAPDEMVGSRLAFLLLECIMTRTAGRHAGIDRALKALNVSYTIEQIVEYLEKVVSVDPQLKFLLPVFKSRLAVEVLSNGKHVDSQIRSARKDLKTAMEVFQHKLRVEPANSTATADSSDETMLSQQQQQPPSSVVLQKMNQAALSLKAHLEQLKGNTKKSLILCSEAVSAVVGEQNAAVHSNNLGCLYETNHRRQLALYALSKSLRELKTASSTENGCCCLTADGTAVPDYSVAVLHNVGICALRACNHEAAYDCLAATLGDPIYRERATTWLRLAEACMGIHHATLREQPKFSRVLNKQGDLHGVVVNNSMFVDHGGVVLERLEPVVGSPEDQAQVRRNPLLRADSALSFVVSNADDLDTDTLLSARLNYCFVCLCFQRYDQALELAKAVLATDFGEQPDEESALLRLRRRNIATARMYAAEASCRLGEMRDAMSFLVGQGQDDAYEQLASQLSGVTFEMASTNESGKRRLAKAHEMVLSSACAISAAVGNLTYAKQLARRADSMDSTRSYARRALIYSLLREEKHWQALDMLLSLQ